MSAPTAVLLALLGISSWIYAADDQSFYVGVSGGLVMPMDMLEEWSWEELGQSADLKEKMKNGFMLGLKLGFRPEALKILAIEVEYTYQRAEFDKIMSPGFNAGPYIVDGFYSDANDSYMTFNSLFLNIIARYPEGRMHPYVGIGPGMTRAYVSFNEPNLTTEGFGFQESGDDDIFCYQIIAGVDYDVDASFSIGAGYKYFAAKPTITWANGTQSDYDPVTHSFVLDVKYKF